MDRRLITLRSVVEMVTLSKSEVYRRIQLGTFPRPVRLGPQRIAFLEADIHAWIDSTLTRGAASRTKSAENYPSAKVVRGAARVRCHDR
jgi:prophage regulatory protein